MPDTFRPGNLNLNPLDFSGFYNSMAEAMEDELDALMALDGLAPVSKDESNREVRDRRRFMIAIARGVVRHLADHSEAIKVTHDSDTVFAQIDTEQL
ncbi:MAG: hypothetical protein WBB25_01860 [Sulfitobacter sp.]